MNTKHYRIFVLGAGFSKAAGLPLASELWSEIRRRAQFLEGRAGKFHTDLAWYVDYRRQCDGVERSADEVDFEDFMRVLDIEHFLGLRGKDTWSEEDGNEGTVVVKTIIGKILAELTPASDDIPAIYLEFAKRLQSNDLVLTFNYDVLLERALDAVGKPYRLFPDRYKAVREDGSTTIDLFNEKEEVIVLKLHGSINWFDRQEFSWLEKYYRQFESSSSPTHPVFSNADALGISRLLEGPRPPGDPLGEMYRVRDIEALYQRQLMFYATPWLLAPSTMKILYAEKLRGFWYGLARGGGWNFGMAIIGYSLPPQDEYARQAIYTLVKNYQEADGWENEVLGLRKSPLVIVDYCPDSERLQQCKDRYKFVDWNRAMLHTEGFNQKAIDVMFNAE